MQKMTGEQAQAKRARDIKSGKTMWAGFAVLAVILAVLWIFWRMGAAVFGLSMAWDPIDRLSITVIAAAVLHAHFIRERK